ncbi:MAG: 2,5-diketo-D-gluconate reductase [Reyranella sp.]|nr:2,5-diketo-D-gluconate reductase [Reyranella sp.]
MPVEQANAQLLFGAGNSALSQAPMLDYLRNKAIPLTAYAPLAQGRAANDPTLAAIGRKHGATAP